MTLLPFEAPLLAALLLLGLELVTGSFVCLGFSAGCLAVAIVEAATGAAALARDAPLFAVVSLAAIALLRWRFRHHDDSKRADGDVNRY